ncbi:hypothetical protein [Schaalia vaccimaxillae]|uniref:hypothetical protein n=1 Tax=Schaalia vaccimaxillae TaxID=183916 RepID=UPI00103971E5|nr:hypothetical protein [Schaalia vaccimaxillae]
MKFHVWFEDGRWCYGTVERNERRFADISSPDPVPVFNWFLSQLAPSFGPRPIWLPSDLGSIRPGWEPVLLDGYSEGTLVGPDGVQRDIRMYATARNYSNLVQLSWIIDADPVELLNSYLDPQGRPLLTRFVKEQ